MSELNCFNIKPVSRNLIYDDFMTAERLEEATRSSIEPVPTTLRTPSHSVARYLEDRIRSSIVTQPNVTELTPPRPDNIVMTGSTVREASVFVDIEKHEPVLKGIVGDAVLATSNALVGERPLPKGTTKKDPEAKRLLDLIDNAAGNTMLDGFAAMEDGVLVIGEGGRDNRDNGQDVILVEGEHGGNEVTLKAATDAVDNTIHLVTYNPDVELSDEDDTKPQDVSISIVALASGRDGITELADTYWQKMIGPRVEGLSIRQHPREIIKAWLKASNLNTPEERKRFILTTLDRPDVNVNGEIIEAALAEGITLDLPNGGDVLPTAFAGENEDGTVRAVFTRGGGPEAGLSAAIVRSLEGVKDLDYQARLWDADPEKLDANEVWDLDRVVPSKDLTVVIGLITDDDRYSGLRGVPVYTEEPVSDDQKVNMITTSSKGVIFTEYQKPYSLAV